MGGRGRRLYIYGHGGRFERPREGLPDPPRRPATGIRRPGRATVFRASPAALPPVDGDPPRGGRDPLPEVRRIPPAPVGCRSAGSSAPSHAARLPAAPGHGFPSPAGRPLFRRDGRPAETVHRRRDRAGRRIIRGRSLPVSGSDGTPQAFTVWGTARRFEEPLSTWFRHRRYTIAGAASGPGPDTGPNPDPLRLRASRWRLVPRAARRQPPPTAGPGCPAPEAHGVRPAALPGAGAAAICRRLRQGRERRLLFRHSASVRPLPRGGVRLRQHAPAVTRRTAWPIPHTTATR